MVAMMDDIQDYKYKFSIVMAVYNVEPFIEEAIDSVINQTIGFRENVQLILVDDGSPDNSGAICDAYKEQYPDNIIVIHKENGGVSSARNEGLKYIQGKYVNFLDSDDKLSENTLEEVYLFFEQHYDEIDVVSIPLYFFDAQEGEHILNYKFKKGNRVINLRKEYDAIQLSLATAFVKGENCKKYEFDIHLKYAEDAKLVSSILLEKMKLGVVSNVMYLYRKRTIGEASALQSSIHNKAWYSISLQYFTDAIIQQAVDRWGYIPHFIQYTLMYDLQWKLKQEKIPLGVLTEKEQEEYYNLLFELIARFDDKIILEQKNLAIEYKVFLLKKKYNRMPQAVYYDNNLALHYENTYLTDFASHKTVIEFIKFDDELLTIEGHTGYIPFAKQHQVKVFLNINDYYHECKRVVRNKDKVINGETILYTEGFNLSLPLANLKPENFISVYVELNGIRIRKTNLSWGAFSPVTANYENQYYINQSWRVTAQKDCINICKHDSSLEKMKLESKFVIELLKSKKRSEQKAGVARIMCSILKFFQRKPIWLISDRRFKAGDNGEAFFRYLVNNHKDINTYFVVSKNCPDYEKMRKVGRVLDKNSFKHKLLLLLSEYIISSHADLDCYNPFIGYSDPYRDYLAENKFIFLQHGVIIHNLPDYLNKYNKNITGMITTAIPEYNSMIDENNGYFYTENNIWLTGLPRFDRLYDNREKMITIIPTWRKYLMANIDSQTGFWKEKDGFLESEFYKFYNNILNNERLLEAAEKFNYQIAFFPHPNLQMCLNLFNRDNRVAFIEWDTEYREVYAKSDLVLTDYSSAIFDFAYLRKPVIYMHFDEETFFSGNHTLTKGYFDYQRDAFGEVEYTVEETVDRIIEYMENGCQLKDKYRARIDNFFAFNDKNNCQRVYDEIMKLGK